MNPVSKDVFTALSLLKPYDINREKIRVGNPRDGAYIIVDADSATDIISFGISNDVGFEMSMAARGHRLFMFDHTIDALPGDHEAFNFFKLGIGALGDANPELLTMEEHLRRLPDLSDRLILKIDVEGYEWEVFRTVTPQILRRFDQIVIEIHWLSRLSDPVFRQQVTDALRNINEQFTLYHVHANNCCELALVDGFAVADVLEISYVRTSLVDRQPSRSIYPTPHNRGNHPNACDLPLLFYPFLPTTAGVEEIGDMIGRLVAEVGTNP